MTKKSESNKRTRESEDAEAEVVVDDGTPPLTLAGVLARVKQLLARIPGKDETAALTVDDLPAMERWCKTVRGIIRNYNLTLNFVAIANYQWEPDRPGHTGQSLGALRNQISLSNAQTNIISSHIGKVLMPILDRELVKKRTVELANGDKEETYEYKKVVSEPEMLQLTREQLCEEAIYKRQLVISAMEQMCQCITDYEKAEAGAAGGDAQRFSMAY